MAVHNIIEAVNLTLKEEMKRDDRVIVLGEDVGVNGGVFRATVGRLEELGEDGVNGYRMEDPWDIAALADRVDRLRDKPHAQALGLAAREVGTRISMAAHTKKMLDLYRTINTDGKRE